MGDHRPTPAPSLATTFVDTRVAARLDRLPWSRFHTLVVVALGITWILDGLEVTLVGALSPAIERGLGLSATQVGLLGSAYIGGAVAGALLFGRLTDTWGRRRLFFITVLVYLVATMASGFAWDFASLAVFRFLTGLGIGGEYAAVNSAIQELVPARVRGVVDLAINGSFWIGAGLGGVAAIVVLDPQRVPQDLGWRIAFVVGGLLALVIVWVRRFVPESPRWLVTHGRADEGERIVRDIERGVERQHGLALAVDTLPTMRFARHHRTVGLLDVARVLLRTYPSRTLLGVTLMATQAFCYNAVFFTYALVLTRFHGVAPQDVGWFILPFAAGNFLGPLLLGPLFDRVGRKPMIAGTYAAAGVLLAATGVLFAQGVLTAATQTAAWCVVFFFASAGASAAYLTVGEVFPLETRAMTIGLFYAFGTAVGGIAGPALFGALIEQGDPRGILGGYLVGGGLMLLAAVLTLRLGVRAERRSLEDVAPPLSLAPGEAPGPHGAPAGSPRTSPP